jgi:hypothetical protein
MELRRRFQETPARAIILFGALALALAAMALLLSGPRHVVTGVPGPALHSAAVGKEPDTADLDRQPAYGTGASTEHEDGILQHQP